MKRVVLTGGPCSGKTTTLSALQEEFGEQILIVPEVATMLLEGGFPVPGKDVTWSELWQSAFQAAVLPLQKSFEDAFALKCGDGDNRLLISDRGILDGAAYTPGGVAEFARLYNVDVTAALTRYQAIIHLESLAVCDPSKYGKTGNKTRFEPLERAVELEQSTKHVWQHHPHRVIIDGRRGIDGKIAQVIGIVRFLLCETS